MQSRCVVLASGSLMFWSMIMVTIPLGVTRAVILKSDSGAGVATRPSLRPRQWRWRWTLAAWEPWCRR